MMLFENAPQFLVIGVLVLVVCSGALLNWGRGLPQKGVWLLWGALVLAVADLSIAWSVLINESAAPKSWLRGWIWPREELGAVLFGISLDHRGLILTTWLILIVLLIALNSRRILEEARPERVFSALTLGVAGSMLSFVSLTPWCSFIGLALTVAAGFISLGGSWGSDEQSELAARYGWERFWGLLLTMIGTAVLSSRRSGLTWGALEAWNPAPTSSGSDPLGAGIWALGLFIQTQSFPFLGWTVRDSRALAPTKILIAHVLPSFCAFIAFVQAEPFFHATGLMPWLGWVAFGSAALSLISGCLQERWQAALGAWYASGVSIAIAVLAFSGSTAALALLLGVSIGAVALASAADALTQEAALSNTTRKQSSEARGSQSTKSQNHSQNHSQSHSNDEGSRSADQKGGWARAGSFLAMAPGTGLFGFVSLMGGLRWFSGLKADPVLLGASVTTFFLFVLSGWRVAWSVTRGKTKVSTHWYGVVLPILLVLLGLGIFWSGELTGGALAGHEDRVTSSLLATIVQYGPKVS